MKKFLMAMIVFGALASAGCAALPYQTGVWYTDYQTPLQATQNDTGSKMGEACQTNILGLIATGDASISTAAQNGGVTKINSVDTNFNHILGIFSKTCTRVSGT